MKQLYPEPAWPDSRETVTQAELSRVIGISLDELDELVGYGALLPLEASPQERLFGAGCIVPLRRACRLRTDFDLDLFTVALLLEYVSRIEILEQQLHSLQAQIPSRTFIVGRSNA